MTETLNRPEHPEHFSEVHHENGEALMCMSSGGVCRVLVEVMPGYSPEEQQQLIESTTRALEAVNQLTSGRAAEIFTGLHIKLGEDETESGGAFPDENTIVLNTRKMLLSLAEMRRISGSYDDEELADFPDVERPGGALEYTLAHEMGHILDGHGADGKHPFRVSPDESPTQYGRIPDEYHDEKYHEAFAEGFAHMAWGMSVSEAMEAAVREAIDERLQEITENQTAIPENGVDRSRLAKTIKLMERMHAAEVLSTPEQAKEFLDSLSYDEFKKWLGFVNGVERGIPRSERGKVSDSHVRSENPLMGAEVEYRPPHKDFRDQLLKMAFEKAQSVDSPEAAALTLGLSINAIHYFDDGNGRTARMAYTLLSRGYDGSRKDQEYYSSLLENTKGREVVNPNPAVSGIDKKIRSEMFTRIQKKSGYSEAFGDNPPTYVYDGYPDTFAGEYSPQKIAAGDGIDDTGRLMLYHIMESGGMTMISLMLTFGPERVEDFVRTSSDGQRTFVDGNEFLPTLTQEEISKWWNNSEHALASYVRRLIDVADREDFAEVAEHYRR